MQIEVKQNLMQIHIPKLRAQIALKIIHRTNLIQNTHNIHMKM